LIYCKGNMPVNRWHMAFLQTRIKKHGLTLLVIR
jgi:hypothetical protein